MQEGRCTACRELRTDLPRVIVRTTLTRQGSAGANTLRFSGRVGRRKLRPGAYRAQFTATDAAGNRSRTPTVRFTIVRKSP